MDYYSEAMAALRAAGIHPYVVNEKNPQRGYQRMWKIFIPAHDGVLAQTIWTGDDPAERDQALARLVNRYCAD